MWIDGVAMLRPVRNSLKILANSDRDFRAQ